MVETPRHTDIIPPVVLAVLQSAAAEEDFLRAKGATEERIKSKVGLGRKLALLAARGIDISIALPPEETQENTVESEITELEEKRVERLMDTTGVGYNEALKRIRAS